MGKSSPHIIEFPTFQNKGNFLNVGQFDQHVPFVPARIYWSYGSEQAVERGNHYHPDSERVIICMNGIIDITIEDLERTTFKFKLEQPNHGVVVPKNHWITMRMSENAVMMALASTNYSEGESVNDYSKFDELR